MYLPDEDSTLLLKPIKNLKLKNKLCLDLGCGSCFIAEELAKRGAIVIASDIDFVFDKIELKKGVYYINCDLLKCFARVFDYIFFNPPYLIFDEREGYYLDTTGGLKGYETTIRFIDQLINALKIGGEAYLILSNYTINQVINKIRKEGIFSIKILESKDLIFEKIFLAKIEYSDFIKNFDLNKYKCLKLKFFNKGKRSIVLQKKDGWLLKLSLKNKKEFFYLNYIKNRIAYWNLFLPEFYLENNILFLKKIEGLSLKEIKEIINKENKKKNEKKWLKLKYKIILVSMTICFLLDKLKINKFEMNHPEKHILFDGKKVYFIDFERAKFDKKPKNFTQFISFIAKEIKEDFNINIMEEIRDYLKYYKKNYSFKEFKKIKNFVKETINKSFRKLT